MPPRSALALALLPTLACSLLCRTEGLAQPCDASHLCAAALVCDLSTNECVPPARDAGPPGCSSDDDCPAGACVLSGSGPQVTQLCVDTLQAWSGGAQAAPALACYANFPPPPLDGGAALYPLDGCIETLPGDLLSGEPSVAFGAQQASVSATQTCLSGYFYNFMENLLVGDGGVPVGELFTLTVDTDAGLVTSSADLFLSSNLIPPPERNAFSLTPARLAALLGQLDAGVTGDGGPLGGGTLVLGVVEDCAPGTNFLGSQLSGVQVVVQRSGQPVAYLNRLGVPVPGRTATDSTGLYASYVPKGAPPMISLSYLQALPDGGQAGFGPAGSVVALEVQGPGVLWVPLAPAGP